MIKFCKDIVAYYGYSLAIYKLGNILINLSTLIPLPIRHLTKSYAFKMNIEFNKIMIDTVAINTPILFSFIFAA